MNRSNWKIAAITDVQVCNGFRDILAELGGSGQLYVHVLGHQLPQVSAASWESDEILARTVPASGASLTIALRDISGVPGLLSLTVSRPNEGMDEIEVGYSGGAVDLARIVIAVQKVFPKAPRLDGLRQVFGEEVSKYYQQREHDLVRLESTVQDVLSRAADYRREMDEEVARRRVAVDAQAATDRATLQAEFDEKQAQLDTDRKALNERQESIDNRESKHARRELRKGLQQVLSRHAEKFSLTRDTATKRRPVHGLFIVALIASVAYVAATVIEGWGKAHDLIYAFRVGVGVLGFGGTMLFYIRWVDSWFKQHADEEFTLKRMSLDIDRASWVVETAMEWQKENNAPVPDLMLERLTSDLFARRVATSVSHPAEDALSTVLGAAARVRVQLPGGSSIDLDRKSAKAIREVSE